MPSVELVTDKRVIRCGDSQRWQRVLDRCGSYDFYHTSRYHAFHESQSQQEAVLIVHEEGDRIAAFPLLIRSLADTAGVPSDFHRFNDATSVYGYSGPVSNTDWVGEQFVERFCQTVEDSLRSLRVIAAFSRMHPLLVNCRGLNCLGETSELGSCVSIDLTLPRDRQLAQYRDNHRWSLRRGRRMGLRAEVDETGRYFDDFVRLYDLTMKSVGAQPWYRFDTEYLVGLRTALGSLGRLLVVKDGEKVVCAGLFTVCQDVIQYHLGGYDPRYRKFSPNTLLIDRARCWGNQLGANVLFLGGGVGAKADSLLHFKEGFSQRQHTFRVWRMVLEHDLYNQAVEHHGRWLAQQCIAHDSPTYFPRYRAHEPSVAKH